MTQGQKGPAAANISSPTVNRGAAVAALRTKARLRRALGSQSGQASLVRSAFLGENASHAHSLP